MTDTPAELLAEILAKLPAAETRKLPDRAFMFAWGETAYPEIDDLRAAALEHITARDATGRSVTIGEYVVRDRRSHLPDAVSLCEDIQEKAWNNEAGENVEYSQSPLVLALAEALLSRMSAEGDGWMVGTEVGEHLVTLDGLQPMLDGKPWGDPLPTPDEPTTGETLPARRVVDGELVDVVIQRAVR